MRAPPSTPCGWRSCLNNVVQTWPPSTEPKIPAGEAMKTRALLVGSTATALTLVIGRASVSGSQCAPPSVVFHKPVPRDPA
jgi:hypothetical protein